MNSRKLVILTGMAAALAVAAVWTSRNESRHTTNTGIGEPVLPGFKDALNNVSTLSIRCSASTITVSRADGIWRIPAKWGYPADFARIRDALNKLADLKTLQTLHTTPAERADLQLLTAADAGSSSAASQATEIQLLDGGGQPLARLYVGKTRARPGQTEPPGMGDYPDGQYVMTGAGHVRLVGEILQEFTQPVQSWLDPEFINLTGIRSIEVDGAAGGSYHAERSKPDAEFTFRDPVPAGQEADGTKLNQSLSLLSYLRFDDVADPSLTPQATGLDKPVTCQARTDKGEILTLRIGGSPAGDARRFATVSVAFEPPPMPPAAGTNLEAAAKAYAVQNGQTADAVKALNARFSPWIYLLAPETAGSLASGLADYLKEKPQPESRKTENK